MPFNITFSSSNGITLPSVGLGPQACHLCTGLVETSLLLSTNSASGPVLPTVLGSVQRVGVLTQTKVSYGELAAVISLPDTLPPSFAMIMMTSMMIFFR